MNTGMRCGVLLLSLLLSTSSEGSTKITVRDESGDEVPRAAVKITTIGVVKSTVESGRTEPDGVFECGKAVPLRTKCESIPNASCDRLKIIVTKGEMEGHTYITWTGSGWSPTPIEVTIEEPAAVPVKPLVARQGYYYKYTPLYYTSTVCKSVYCDGVVRQIPETTLRVVWTRQRVSGSLLPPNAHFADHPPAGARSAAISKVSVCQTCPPPHAALGACAEPYVIREPPVFLLNLCAPCVGY